MSGQEDRDADEVRAALRELPPREPDAALDARVRAAVAAELAGELRSEPAAGARAPQASPASGRVIAFPRWRRVALPLATAATLVIAVGLWQMRGTREAGPAAGTALESVVASAPVATVASDDAARPAPVPEAVERRAAPAQAATQAATQAPALAARRRAEPEYVARNMADAPMEEVVVPVPAASMPAAAPAVPASSAGLASPAKAAPAREATGALATGSAKAVAPAAEKRADVAPAAVPPAPVAVASTPKPEDAATFAEIRRLVAVHRAEEARALLLRWHESHAGTAVPADLQPLLPDAAR